MQSYPGAGQQSYAYVGYQNYPYSGAQVPLYQNPPYHGLKIHVGQAIPSYPGYPPLDFNRKLPFVATLKLLDLTRPTKNPIAHLPWWLIIPTKFHYDIPKINGNPGEYPSTHVMNYHL